MLAPVWDVLVYVVLPLWVLAGFADYLCHRATDIEHASGPRESAIHWLMLGEVGVPLLAAVFLKVNALVMAVMIVFLVAHEITGNLDLKLAMRTRYVSPVEQQIHSLLEILPFTAMLLVFVLHWNQALALLGLGGERAEWFIGTKPLPSFAELMWPGIAFAVFALLPYAEELIRGFRTKPFERPSDIG
ncbi:MAG: hypothetical protein JOZ72_04495 [Alphaproteobacteria bacterium]|nr:hypothetical protein [Alphaproteobacteria bacterium]